VKAIQTLCLVLLLAPPAWSQQNRREAEATPPQPRKLTLRTALELANRQNLDLAAARQRHGVTLAGVQIARQLPNPIVNLAVLRDTPHEGLFFEQPFEIGGKRKRRIELARQQTSLTDVEISAAERQVRRKVRQAFYTAAAARSQSAQRGQALELSRRLRATAQARFDAGDVPQLEVFQAELEVARAETELTVAQQREKVAWSQLNALLNEPPEMVWEPAGAMEELPPAVTLADLTRRAQESNAELQHLAQEERIEQGRRALLRAERIPTVNLQFGTDFNAPHDFRVGPRSQLSLAVPIFSRNQGELAQAQATLGMLAGQLAATRRAVASRVEASYLEFVARRTQVELFRGTLLSAGRRLQSLAEESYKAGKASILTVLDAQRNVQQIERDYVDSLLGLQAAFAELEETVGAALD